MRLWIDYRLKDILAKMAKKRKRVCRLNEKEDSFWVRRFSDYKSDGLSDKRADEKTFKDLVKKYPRLEKCDKIK